MIIDQALGCCPPLRGSRSRLLSLALATLALVLPACQQKMARQPSYDPLAPSKFFADGRSARTLVPGTVAHSQFIIGDPMITAFKGEPKEIPEAKDYVDTFPFRVQQKDLLRGQERYDIFCAVCHDTLGYGNGKIVERGYLPPPSFHTDLSRRFERYGEKVPLRNAPTGYYFEVISKGYGGMPSYASQIPPRDRWLIVAYIRTLVFSQRAPLDSLPPEIKKKAVEASKAREQLSDSAGKTDGGKEKS